MACKAAVEAEIPAVAQRLSPPGLKRKATQVPIPAAAHAIPDPSQSENSKTRLNQVTQLLKGSTLVKGDIVYECVEVDGGFVANVTLVPVDASYEGLPGASKKLAEQNAAEVALEALQDRVAPLEEEHLAKKAKLKKESFEKFKQRRAAAAQE